MRSPCLRLPTPPCPPAEIPTYLSLPSLSVPPAHQVEYEQKRKREPWLLFFGYIPEKSSRQWLLVPFLAGYARHQQNTADRKRERLAHSRADPCDKFAHICSKPGA